MTVVNAIKFNDHSGAMVCDEQASWGAMSRKGDVADKIQNIIPDTIQRQYGIAAAYGGSGTSAIAEEIKIAIHAMLNERYKKLLDRPGRMPESFMTIQEIAAASFEKVAELKRRHIDELLSQKYGFTGRDFIRGYYERDGKRIDISQKEIADKALDAMTWRTKTENQGLYVNRGILAGYDPGEGFRIFVINLRSFSCEPVQAIFSSIGSGQDTSDLVFSQFAGLKTVHERMCDIDPVEAMVAIIDATNTASRNNVGIGGYFNLMLFDGSKTDHLARRWEISDNRARLASEVVAAHRHGLVTRKTTHDIITDIVFAEKSFDQVDRLLRKRVSDWRHLCRFFRGYKVD
ncbi:hypothetical protein JW905_16020 [bacterium]|nr:hypothetical protein [candidate division CSSED10-310 bacterium]